METDRREALRYLGYGRNEADETVKSLLEECLRELEQEAKPGFLMREFPLKISDGGVVDGGCFQAVSRSLAGNLAGCGKILLMAATLGAGADRLLIKYGRLSVTKAVVMQAAASAMIEAYCNELCRNWKQEYERKGWFLRPRFSPGYGDFALSCQPAVLNGLEADKRLGLTLTDGGLMVPSKSVTAVIGAGRIPAECRLAGCDACQKKECAFRR